MNILETISIVISLLVSLVSLIISVVAMKITQRAYLHESRDFLPEIEFSIDEKDNLKISNKSSDLFKILGVNLLKIKIIGFDDHVRKRVVQFPFIVRSVMYDLFENRKNIEIQSDQAGACAYICKYDSKLVSEIENRVYSNYDLGSEAGYALPSLQTVRYYIELVYINSFQERSSIVFLYGHAHGQGFYKTKISDEAFRAAINRSDIPKFESSKKLWAFLLEKYSYTYKNFYGTDN